MLAATKFSMITTLLATGAVLAGGSPPAGSNGSVATSGEDTVSGRVVIESATSARISPAGATVMVSWIPGLENAKDGDVLNVTALAATKTDDSGVFTLHIPRSQALSRASGTNDGRINLTAGGVMPNGDSRTIDFSWDPASGLTMGDLNDYQKPNLDVRLKYDLSDSLINGFSDASSSNKLSAIPTAGPTPAALALGCQFITDSTFNKYTAIVNGHSDTHSKIQVSYGATADSDIDVGLRNFNTSWGVNGSVHIGTAATSGSDTTVYGAFNGYFNGSFSYIKGHFSDYFGAPNGTTCKDIGYRVGDEKVTAVKWQGGGITTSTGAGSGAQSCLTAPRSSYKTILPNNGHTWISSTAQTKISVAVTTPYITLGAKSGFSTRVRQDWWGTAGNGVYICGQYGPLSGSPGIVYVQNV